MIKFTVLGSGNFIPCLERHSSGHLIQTEKENIVFDFGRGTIENILKKKLTLYDLDYIFISHPHSDHLSDFGAFLGWAAEIPRIEKSKRIFKVYGPKGIKKAIEHLMRAFGIYYNFEKKDSGRLEIVELNSGEVVKTKSLKIKGIGVEHSSQWDNWKAMAYRIEYKDKIICYSGDSPSCEGLREACKNADLAVMECTLPKKANVKCHISGDELGLIAKEENIKKLIVVHVDNDYRPFLKKDIRKNYKGKLIIAKDMDEFKV